jgi:Transmembrane Fragile-X-F protein
MSAEGPASRRRGPKLTIGFNTPLMLALFVLIGLKLGGVVTWSWWGVFAPVWIALLSILAFLLPLSGLALSYRIGEYRQDRRYRRLDRPPPWIGSRRW